MNKKQFVKRLSERTGFSSGTAAEVIECLDDKNIFSKKEQSVIAAEIAVRAGCDEARAEEIRKDMMKIISEEIRRQSRGILKVCAAVIAVLLITAKLKGKAK